jgi:hypothetical protein
MTNRIQAEVRISDILELLKAKHIRHFICYNIAYLLRYKLALVPGYEEFLECHVSDCIADGYGGSESREYRMGSYYFIERKKQDGIFSSQVVNQLNRWIYFFEYKATVKVGYLSDTLLEEIRKFDYANENFVDWHYASRIVLLEKILKSDPDAVIVIDLEL